MKFRKKPVVVEAEQLTQAAIDSHVLDKTPLPDGVYLSSASAHPPTRVMYRAVVRLIRSGRDSGMPDNLVMPGDWIIRDPDGTFSVCKPDAFEATYEPVPSSAMPWIDSHRKDPTP